MHAVAAKPGNLGRCAAASVVNDGVDEERSGSQGHQGDGHGPPPRRQALTKYDPSHTKRDGCPEKVAAPSAHNPRLTGPSSLPLLDARGERGSGEGRAPRGERPFEGVSSLQEK